MVRKALIPVAGKGTRLIPVTKVIPKALFPLVDGGGKIRTVLDVICRQAVWAGAKDIGIVISPWQSDLIKKYLAGARDNIPQKELSNIEFITQQTPNGFGDAVLRARDFVADEPFMLLLGDHIQIPDKGVPACGHQLALAFDSMDAQAMVGVRAVTQEELSRVGAAAGVPVRQNIYSCTCFIEKPDLKTARQRLHTPGLAADNFLAHCGLYVFSPKIFDCLEEVRAKPNSTADELELADAQNLLLKKYPKKYFLYKINGRAYDMGTPEGYAQTQADFRNAVQNP